MVGRLFQTSGGSAGVTRFLYDGDELIGEYDAAGTLLRRYVHGAGVDDPLVWYEGATVAAASRRQLFADYQGSIISHTTGSGVLGGTYSYDDWGVPNTTLGSRFRCLLIDQLLIAQTPLSIRNRCGQSPTPPPIVTRQCPNFDSESQGNDAFEPINVGD